jgi:hypothetical protein
MKAVIKAILMDPEARSVESYMAENGGRIREPFVRAANAIKSLPILTNKSRYWCSTWVLESSINQLPLHARTVFNFYLPDHQPVGPLVDLNLVSPELKIHNTNSSLSYVNLLQSYTWGGSAWGPLCVSQFHQNNDPDGTWWDPTFAITNGDDSEIIINYLDKVFTHGQLTDATRNRLRTALNNLYYTWSSDYKNDRYKTAIYLLMASTDYTYIK